MLFFDPDGRRGKLRPRSLDSTDIENAKHQIQSWLQLDPRRREQSDVPPVWKIAFEPDVLSALSELSHGRCAFCEETRTDLAPYRFRPPGYAEPPLEPARKGAYVWLAFAWPNLFPICPDCRPARPNWFPVAGQTRSVPASPFDEIAASAQGERPIFLHPGELLDPLAFGTGRSDGTIVPSARSRPTVETFRLNRLDLADRRRMAWEGLIDRIEGRQAFFSRLVLSDELLRLFLRDSHGGFLFLLAQRLAATLGLTQGRRAETPVTLEDVTKALAKFAATAGFAEPLREAVATMAAEDSGTTPPLAQPVVKSAGRLTPQEGFGHTTPRLESVELVNFKSLEDIAFAIREVLHLAPIDRGPTEMRPPEAPCLMLLGENSTGKSSILEAIALACVSQETLEQLVGTGKLEPRRLQLNPRYMGQVGDGPENPPTSIRVGFHDGAARSCHIVDGQLTRDAEGEEAPPLLFAFGAHRLAGSGPARALSPVATLFDDHAHLASPEDWLRGLDESALNEVASALRYIIQIDGEFEYIDFIEGPEGKPVCMLHFQRPDAGAPGGKRPMAQPLRLVSSGYRAVLALVVEILRGLAEANPELTPYDARMARAIVLVDEIEAHLHPRWKLHIMTGLRRALPNVTFIVTSHDPLCVRGMFNGEVMALNRYDNVARDGRALPERVEQVKDFENVEAMTVDQLLTSPMFGLFSAESETLNRRLAAASDILAQKQNGEPISAEDEAILNHLYRSIAAGLPVGKDMIDDLVRTAVAQYLKAQREAGAHDTSEKRTAAVAAVRSFLETIGP